MDWAEFEELLWKWAAKQQDDSGLGFRSTSLTDYSGAFDFKSSIPYFEEEVSRVEAIIQRYAARPENVDKAKALNAKYGATRDFYDAGSCSAQQIAARLGISRPVFNQRVMLAQESIFNAYLELWVYREKGAA